MYQMKIILAQKQRPSMPTDSIPVMVLPLAMLKSLQLRTMAKVGLAGVFCCAFITIAFDISRAVETVTNGGTPGSTALWTNLESAIAVIVSCLPSLKALLGPRRNHGAGRVAGPYNPRPLAISESAKSYMSAGSSDGSGATRLVAAARCSESDDGRPGSSRDTQISHVLSSREV